MLRYGEYVFTNLTRKVFGFEQTYMYEILVTGPLFTSECAGECQFSANLCKRALNVTADAIVDATRNADLLTINISVDFQQNALVYMLLHLIDCK